MIHTLRLLTESFLLEVNTKLKATVHLEFFPSGKAANDYKTGFIYSLCKIIPYFICDLLVPILFNCSVSRIATLSKFESKGEIKLIWKISFSLSLYPMFSTTILEVPSGMLAIG